MNFWKSLAGMAEVEVTSACIELTFEAIRSMDIPIFQVHTVSDLTSRFLIFQKDFRKLNSLCKKRGETFRMIRRQGLYWTGVRFLHRPVLCIGLCCIVLFALVIPRHVFFVEVEGNLQLQTRQILEAAEACGIGFGATRREVRSEKVKNALLAELPELQWAGVNTRGCVAVISVRERTMKQAEEEEYRVSSIVADRDGLILNCTATRGNLICKEGQAVREGELLISGYTDCGLSIQATCAQGEVFAQTNRKISVLTPKIWLQRSEARKETRSVSIVVGKKRINLWKGSGIWDTSCGRMYQEYYLTLPGGFRLPVALCVDKMIHTDLSVHSLIKTQTDMDAFVQQYLSDHMAAGKILHKKEEIEERDDCYLLRGSYICEEMIGREKMEKIGE